MCAHADGEVVSARVCSWQVGSVCAGDRRWKGVCALNGEVVSVVHPTRWECVYVSIGLYVCVCTCMLWVGTHQLRDGKGVCVHLTEVVRSGFPDRL